MSGQPFLNASPSSLVNLSSTHVFCGCMFIVNVCLLLLWHTNYNFSLTFHQCAFCGHESLVNMSLWFLLNLSLTFSIITHTKNTAKKCTGGSVPCIHLKILRTAAKSLSRGQLDGSQSLEMSKLVHHNEGTPYYGFYHTNGVPILESFLQVHTSLELSSLAELLAAPVIFIHLILVDFDTMASPLSLAHSFLQPYFTSGSIEYHEIAYNIVSDVSGYCKTVRQIIKDLKNMFVWEHAVVGDPFAGYSLDGEKHYAGTPTEDFLDGIFSLWQSLLDHANETYLWLLCCGAIVNNSDSFAGLQCTVLHLKVSKFVWADVNFQPWSGFLSIQYPSCWWTNSWRSVFVRGCKDKVYVFECKNDTYIQSFSFRPPEGATMLTLDIMTSWTLVFNNVLNEHKDSFVAAKGNSIIRAHILKTIKDAIGSSEAAKDPCIMLPEKNLQKAVRAYYLDFLKDDEDQYDKQHRDTSNSKSMGQRTRLAYMWHQAMSPEVKRELERVAGKWNQEGPPADTKDRTMGLHVVILAAYDRGEGKAPGTTVLVSKAERLYLEKPKNLSLSLSADGEDDDENDLSDLTVEVNDDDYPCLPTGFGSLKLKHRQQLIQTVFRKAYTVITNNPRAPVPWGEISNNPNYYLDSGCIPENVVIRDPSYLQKDMITVIYSHWKDCTSHDMLIGAAKDKEGLLNKVADDKSSSDEDEVEVETPTIANSSPKFHLARDMVPYLKSLSTVPSYSCLLTVVQKLPQRIDSKSRKQQLPVWASWTWSQAYLPQDIYENMKITSATLEHLIVSLEIGPLLHECHHAQEYEANEAGDDVSDYLGNSILGIQMGDQIEEKVIGIGAEVEVMLKDENLELFIVRQDIEKRHLEGNKKLKEKRRVEDEKRVEEETRLAKKASKVDTRVRKSHAKGKGKWPAINVEELSKKKVKVFFPDPPYHFARDKAPPKKYNV
ncbi:uncharacterized protein F5147DRAFT_758686 [Suillus discolor]|uniref:Uncharacterized protein n=1 Tax=Suillus discolor TaxID=1912936 RepID=A0A9P7FEP4_9AGAM|nr:uncharacterized protein F5147DRAFT_758686 [Suillus discolor]KAG2115300.1 hypothetical protein F5147DRAFT_758686 [Suillus discolor]